MSPELSERLLRLNLDHADYTVDPERVVWLACDLLIAGLDSPALRELAGESPARLGESDATALVRQVLVELGSTLMTSEEADWYLGREVARKILAGAPRSEWNEAGWRVNVRMDSPDEGVYVAIANFDADPGPYLGYVREYLRLAEERLTGW